MHLCEAYWRNLFLFFYWKNEAMVNLKKAKAMYIQKQQELEKVCNEGCFLF